MKSVFTEVAVAVLSRTTSAPLCERCLDSVQNTYDVLSYVTWTPGVHFKGPLGGSTAVDDMHISHRNYLVLFQLGDSMGHGRLHQDGQKQEKHVRDSNHGQLPARVRLNVRMQSGIPSNLGTRQTVRRHDIWCGGNSVESLHYPAILI